MTDKSENSNSTFLAGIIGVFLLFFLFSFLGSEPVLQLFGLTKINLSLLWFSRVLCWLIAAILWLYAAKIEKRKVLLWNEKYYGPLEFILSIIVVFAAMFFVLAAVGVVAHFSGLNTHSAKMLRMLTIFKENQLLLVFTAFTAGVVEEFIFRGYMQPRLEIIFKNPYAAILVSSLTFGFLHIGYGTALNVVGPFLIGLIFAFYYWKFRNIKVIMICHFLWDLILMYVQTMKHR